MEEASYLMDRPMGGWSELVTTHTLDLKLAVVDERFRVVEAKIDALEHKLRAEMERGFRRQTWSMMSVSIAGFTAILAALITMR